jgi:hypothetical protein
MRFFYLFSIILLTTLQAKSQNRTAAAPAPEVKVIKFYPNPAITKITFDFQGNNSKDYSFRIYNFIGKKVFELSAVTDAKTSVDLADFFRGMYIFQLKDKNGKIIESGRFQVSK